jgi:glycosyltransferase involved in cell wall biosynthesis
MTNLIVNLLPIKTGGGLQNAISFVSSVNNDNYIYLVNADSEIHRKCMSEGFSYIAIKNNLFARLLFEIKIRYLFPKNTKCFTYFGPPLIGGIGHFYNINGCAYSNLLHPEVDFWGWCSPLQKLKRKVIDFYRRKMMIMSDEIILETDLLLNRAKNDHKFCKKKLHVVHMSPSKLVTDNTLFNGNKFKYIKSEYYKNILYISGAHPNKRLHLLPDIAKRLKDEGLFYRFIVTLPKCDYSDRLFSKFEALGVSEYYLNVGPIAPNEVSSIVFYCFAMVNLALLESFSNNVVEAWALNKPIILPEADWSLSSCGDAACYVDPSNLNTFVNVLRELNIPKVYDKFVNHGQAKLATMPSLEEKNNKYLEIINN